MNRHIVRWSSALAGAVGGILCLLGIFGLFFGILELADPVGSQMANDADPFGKPPTTAETAKHMAVFAAMAFGGGWLFKWANRKGAAQQGIYGLLPQAQVKPTSDLGE